MMILTRTRFTEQGIFGELTTDGRFLGVTLEHSFQCEPALPEGEYVCVRGLHRLEGMTSGFETFEITGVPGHSGILFHVGNYNRDSKGCVLLGERALDTMILESEKSFQAFMASLSGVDRFPLVVRRLA